MMPQTPLSVASKPLSQSISTTAGAGLGLGFSGSGFFSVGLGVSGLGSGFFGEGVKSVFFLFVTKYCHTYFASGSLEQTSPLPTFLGAT
jgi:hypothetical protein